MDALFPSPTHILNFGSIPLYTPRLSPVSSRSRSVFSEDGFDTYTEDGSYVCPENSGAIPCDSLVFRAEIEFLVQVIGGQENTSGTGHLRAASLQVRLKRHMQEAGLSMVLWGVEVDKSYVDLQESIPAEHLSSHRTWMLARIQSPLMTLNEENLDQFNVVLDTLKEAEDIRVGLNHIPRLRVEVKPLGRDFTLEELKNMARLFWTVSPFIDQLHAKYCGPGSTLAPGLMFANAFNPLPFLDLSEAMWRGETVKTVFDHYRETQLTTKILKVPEESVFSQRGSCMIEAAESVEELVDLLAIRTTSCEGLEKGVLGAYSFSKILNPNRGEKAVLFSQHAGTMDFDAISNWIKVCHGLSSFCVEAGDDRLDWLFSRIKAPLDAPASLQRGYTVLNLLEDVGLDRESRYYDYMGPYALVPDLAVVHRIPTVNLADTPDLSPYSFGVELEFIIPYTKGGIPDPDPSDSRWVYNYQEDGGRSPDNRGFLQREITSASSNHLAEALNAAGHFSSTFDTLTDELLAADEDNDAALVNVARRAGFLVRPEPILDCHSQMWYIHSDYSLSDFHAGVLGYAGIHGLEISSPVMRVRRQDFERVAGAMEIIRASLRPMLDPSCGMHVHVGNVRNFSLRSLKRIVTMVWAADPVIFTLVHPFRKENEYSQPLRYGTRLGAESSLSLYDPLGGDRMVAMELESHIPMDRITKRLKEEFREIWAAEHVVALDQLLHSVVGGSRASVALIIPGLFDEETGQPLKTRPEDRVLCGTIEFRAREGTLDPELVVRWTKLVVAMVEKAETSSTREFYRIMAAVLRRGATEAERLGPFLDALGLGESRDFWARVAEQNEHAELPLLREPSERRLSVGEDAARARHEQNLVPVPKLEDDFWERAARF